MRGEFLRGAREIVLGVDTGPGTDLRNTDGNGHAERQRAQLLELFAHLDIGWRCRDETAQDTAAIGVQSVVMQCRRRGPFFAAGLT